MSENRWQGKKAAFLGDSITFGMGSDSRFADIVAWEAGFSEVYNYGFSGSKITMVTPGDFSFVNRSGKCGTMSTSSSSWVGPMTTGMAGRK